jgi:hypothetical protein
LGVGKDRIASDGSGLVWNGQGTGTSSNRKKVKIARRGAWLEPKNFLPPAPGDSRYNVQQGPVCAGFLAFLGATEATTEVQHTQRGWLMGPSRTGRELIRLHLAIATSVKLQMQSGLGTRLNTSAFDFGRHDCQFLAPTVDHSLWITMEPAWMAVVGSELSEAPSWLS